MIQFLEFFFTWQRLFEAKVTHIYSLMFVVLILFILIRPDQINVLGHGSDRPSFFANSKKKKLPNF